MQQDLELEYAGFWRRVLAMLIDTFLLMLVMTPLSYLIVRRGHFSLWDPFGGSPGDFWISALVPAVFIIGFWMTKGATPGKMVIGARIVCARTGGKPSLPQFLIRYMAYSISTAVLLLGWLWVGIDRRKQGWHDKLAGTVVVRRKSGGTQAVSFDR